MLFVVREPKIELPASSSPVTILGTDSSKVAGALNTRPRSWQRLLEPTAATAVRPLAARGDSGCEISISSSADGFSPSPSAGVVGIAESLAARPCGCAFTYVPEEGDVSNRDLRLPVVGGVAGDCGESGVSDSRRNLPEPGDSE